MPTLRHKLAALVGAVLLCSTVFLYGGSANALSTPVPTQACYPLSTCPPPPCPVGNVNDGTVTVGRSFTFTLCGNFVSGSPVVVTVNGVSIPGKTASNGAAVVEITVQSQTVLAVEDPIAVAAVCGVNTAVATGQTVPGGTATVTGTFTLLCTTTSSGGLAFTGANVLMALLVAFALIVVGALLVVFQRRRRQTV